MKNSKRNKIIIILGKINFYLFLLFSILLFILFPFIIFSIVIEIISSKNIFINLLIINYLTVFFILTYPICFLTLEKWRRILLKDKKYKKSIKYSIIPYYGIISIILIFYNFFN